MPTMQLRSELLPPPVNEQQLQAIGREIERIANLIQHGEPANEAIAVFNRSTGHHYGMHDFAEYQGSRDLADFALEAARPAHPATITERDARPRTQTTRSPGLTRGPLHRRQTASSSRTWLPAPKGFWVAFPTLTAFPPERTARCLPSCVN